MALTKIPAHLSSTPSISDSGSATAITIDSSGNVVLAGNLSVTGSTTTADNLVSADKNITLNYHASNDTSGSADGAGITIQDAVNSSTDATLLWDAAADRFKFSHGLEITGTLDVSDHVRVTTDGSASDPDYQVGGDGDTGMYQPGANQLGFTVAGSRKLYFSTTTGYVQNLSGGLTFSDDVPIKLGSSNDLSIYHDGSDSYIKDDGTGLLFIRGSSGVRIQGANGEAMIHAAENGAVTLYHDNSAKLDTVSGGINVTGNITTSATLSSFTDRIKIINGSAQLNIGQWDGSNHRIEADSNRKLVITSYNSDGIHMGGSGASDLVIKGNKVGIGTTSPSYALDVVGRGHFYQSGGSLPLTTLTAYDIAAKFESSDGGSAICIEDNSSTNNANKIGVNGNEMWFKTANVEAIRIDDNQKVGIGTSDPTRKLHVVGDEDLTDFTSTTKGQFCLSNSDYASGEYVAMDFTYTGSDNPIARIGAKLTGSGSYLSLGTSNSYSSGVTNEALVIDYSGNVGIGTTSPAALLEISGAGDAIRVESTNAGTGGAQMDLLHYTTSPADNDIHALINMGGYTSGTSSAYGSSIRSVWSDVSAKEAQLEFFTRDDSDFAARMIIDKDGRVGIGTDSPASSNDYAETLTLAGSGNTGMTIRSGTSNYGSIRWADGTSDPSDSMGIIDYNHSTNAFRFFTSNGERMRILSGGGLTFNGDTAAANALDDYEEGTFTPSYTVAGGGSVTGVSSTNVGTYTKIGNMVHVTVRSHYVQTTGTVPTAYNMTLPFQAKNTGGMGGSGIGQEIAQTGKNMFISIDGNATTCNIKAPTNGAPPANAYMDLAFTYQAA